ncbi:MAG TPA: hypothetical protein VE398_13040, partial [Acidobacteriota bacterium]|nr:hypothetical protein [Acidobacteriota bacterium]
GTVSTVAVKANRKMTTSEYTGEIVDLDEQKIYNLDMRKKSYEVMTFDEMRRRMQEAQEKAAKAAKEQPQAEAQPSQQQMEIDFSLKDSGQKRTINGFDCHEVIMTITARQKGKTLEEGGGYVMTSHIWLGPVIESMKEVAAFDRRYYQALQGSSLAGSAEQMAMVSAMYPAMREMMGRMETENVKMDGTPILTEMTTEVVKNPEQMSQEAKQGGESTNVTSIRAIGSVLGRKMAKKKEDEETPKNRATIMTMNHELLKVVPTVTASDLSIPAGFKQKK